MLSHCWYFKDIGYKFVIICHDVSMTAYELKSIAILNVKGANYRCVLWGNSKNEAVNILHNFVLEDKGVL